MFKLAPFMTAIAALMSMRGMPKLVAPAVNVPPKDQVAATRRSKGGNRATKRAAAKRRNVIRNRKAHR